MFSFAHLSDLHATPVEPVRPRDLFGKRMLGWLSWRVRRRYRHRPEVLAALIDDVHARAPDQIVITGDLTHVALASEFVAARAWLERVGPPERVFLVPGNHDVYVAIPREISWDLWSAWMAPDGNGAPVTPEFPTLRTRGPAAFVGICSALPTLPLLATGLVGAAQLERLEKLLGELAETERFRVLLIHHPPTAGATGRRRALSDGAALRAVLRRTGADLVLHGHMHRTVMGSLEGPDGPIPVLGVRSASHDAHTSSKRAQYHLFRVAPGETPGPRFRVTLETRGYDPETGAFRSEGVRPL
jgi:3',5'-cyclic AMP phosphodiesterase CpdA